MSSARPQRRRTTHIETLHGELCIYEWTTKTVHALNPAAARVWEMCDGTTTVAEMVAAMQRDESTVHAELIVWHALRQFDRAGLLEPGTLAGVRPVVSRRALLRRLGAVAAIPVVTSIVAPTPLAAQSSRSMTFDFTGAAQFFTVPSGITSLHVDVQGARGSGRTALKPWGGRVQAILPVSPGELLTIVVGGSGFNGGFNGGGKAGANGVGTGGGASDIRRGATRVIVAGGSGGSGFEALLGFGPVGGTGGGLVAGAGGGGTCGGNGGGGTQSAGGPGGVGNSGGASGFAGVLGSGGNGADAPADQNGGNGGGGGYYGGGGGGACGGASSGGAGGGGSSFTDPSATSVVHTQHNPTLGIPPADPVIIITW
jgi:hypothetical protein